VSESSRGAMPGSGSPPETTYAPSAVIGRSGTRCWSRTFATASGPGTSVSTSWTQPIPSSCEPPLPPSSPTGRRTAATRLDVLTSSDSYLLDGRFDTDAMIGFWYRSIGSALVEGFPRARAAGEMTWAIQKMPGVEELIAYEAKLNKYLPRYPQVILCLYDLDRSSGELLMDVLKTHPRVLIGGRLLDNPFYLEPDELLATAVSQQLEGFPASQVMLWRR
jgi:DcmR-like sensory protein